MDYPQHCFDSIKRFNENNPPPETGVAAVARTIHGHADYRSSDPEAATRLALIRGLAEALLEHLEAQRDD